MVSKPFAGSTCFAALPLIGSLAHPGKYGYCGSPPSRTMASCHTSTQTLIITEPAAGPLR